ncbi:MAG: Tm-1-like ATP-binding domain-containing protein [Verrucomicrobiota bacterium]
MKKCILLIATLDTKEEEALFLKKCIEYQGVRVMVMDTGILAAPQGAAGISQEEVAGRGGMSLSKALATKDKAECTAIMSRGAAEITKHLYREGGIHGVIGIGGAQGSEIACTAMQSLPTGVPRLMVSAIANGKHTFGPYVGTKDITIMHTVSDMQGLNFLTRRILRSAAGSICGMVASLREEDLQPVGIPVAMSMLGTTTPGALRAKKILTEHGFEVVAFHQNGTGGIAMEDMILEGAFKGVLDLNLHEIGDSFVHGLHAAIRAGRLERAGALGLPQIVAPGSINYTVQGPPEGYAENMKGRKIFYYNKTLTLVRLLPDELKQVGKIVAQKLNRARGPVKLFIPLRGFAFPDREGLPLWEPEGNKAFIDSVKQHLAPAVSLVEIDAHINDADFIDPVAAEFISIMKTLSS